MKCYWSGRDYQHAHCNAGEPKERVFQGPVLYVPKRNQSFHRISLERLGLRLAEKGNNYKKERHDQKDTWVEVVHQRGPKNKSRLDRKSMRWRIGGHILVLSESFWVMKTITGSYMGREKED